MRVMTFSDRAVERAKDDALDWLEAVPNGYPRSWAQIEADETRRDYYLYDADCPPPILGYEALESVGVVERVGMVSRRGVERVHFRLTGDPLA
jgi:hypothetical protein